MSALMRSILIVTCAALAFPLAAQEEQAGEASGEAAASQEEGKAPGERKWGFHIGVDAYGTVLSGLDLDFAGITDVTNWDDQPPACVPGLDEVTRVSRGNLSLDEMDTTAMWRVSLGATMKRASNEDPDDHDLFFVRGIYYSPSDKDQGTSSFAEFTNCAPSIRVGGLIPTMGTAEQVRLQGENLPWNVTASSKVEAQAFDIIWARRASLKGGWEAGWEAGVRWLSFELTSSAVYTTDTPEAVLPSAPGLNSHSTETVSYESESAGVGPIIGGRIGYLFGQKRSFGLYGQLELAGLFASGSWKYRSVQSSLDTQFPIDDRELMSLESKDNDRTVTTVDVDLGFNWRFARFAELSGGWRTNYWMDVWNDIDLIDPERPTVEAVGTHLEPATFNGLFLGLNFNF